MVCLYSYAHTSDVLLCPCAQRRTFAFYAHAPLTLCFLLNPFYLPNVYIHIHRICVVYTPLIISLLPRVSFSFLISLHSSFDFFTVVLLFRRLFYGLPREDSRVLLSCGFHYSQVSTVRT